MKSLFKFLQIKHNQSIAKTQTQTKKLTSTSSKQIDKIKKKHKTLNKIIFQLAI